jgi:hypothetical protein
MELKLQVKITGSGPMVSHRKRGQGSSWTVVPAADEEKLPPSDNIHDNLQNMDQLYN